MCCLDLALLHIYKAARGRMVHSEKLVLSGLVYFGAYDKPGQEKDTPSVRQY